MTEEKKVEPVFISWTKPNKTVIETNDRIETVRHAEKLGWKRNK